MKIHILGIAGTLTAPLALALQKRGDEVTGADQSKIYPPISTLLKKYKISTDTKIETISPNLVIVGPSFSKFSNLKNDFEYLKSKNISYISATNFIAQNLIKPESILVAGSFGKTTITALLSWILADTNLKPSYMFGGQLINKNFPSLNLSDSNCSVVEADESINGLDHQAKFLYYPVKYLILTSVKWEHKDSYPSAKLNQQAYINLIKKVPKNGFIVFNEMEKDIKPLLQFAQCPCYGYKSQKYPHPQLFGGAFENNLSAVTTILEKLGIDEKLVKKRINSFLGVKRRLEIVFQTSNFVVIDDFAQSSNRIFQSLETINNQFPDFSIYCLLEPHASFLQYKSSLLGLKNTFSKVKTVFLSKISFSSQINKTDRISFIDFQLEIGDKLIYLPQNSDLIHTLTSSLKDKFVLVRFSSGGLQGQKTFNQIVKNLKLII
jgi:UDP-N-acetylmuramate: L-alanyl-gamma-D-glutamyl-meso-diaminopimelate ligase